MKDILDTIIVIMFVIMVALFIINFNKQQIKKYTDKLEENEYANLLSNKFNNLFWFIYFKIQSYFYHFVLLHRDLYLPVL